MLKISEQYFLCVVQTGSFTKASELMYVSQPAISKQISQLEKELGFTLLERNTRYVALTERGRIIYEGLLEVNEIWESTLKNARGYKNNNALSLKLGTLNGWSLHRLPASIFTFQKNHPEINLSIHQYTFNHLTQMLLDQKLDLILTLAPEIPANSILSYKKAFDEEMIIYFSSSHPICQNDELPNYIGNIKLFVMDKNASLSAIPVLSKVVKDRGWDMEVVPMPNIDSIFTAVEQGMGCAITFQSSRVCDSNAYKVYKIDVRVETVLAWKLNNYSDSIHLFINEFES